MQILKQKGAIKDLNEAIRLAEQYEDLKVLSLSLTQKGTILRLNGIKSNFFRMYNEKCTF